MIVVADTSPLNYLIQIDHDFLLPQLYQSVLVPTTVVQELHQATSLPRIQQWLSKTPPWLTVQSVGAVLHEQLIALDPGERDAIQLALIDKADLLLIDERLGRVVANRLGLQTTGTLGVILEAHRRLLIEGAEVFESLRNQTNFRMTRQLEHQFSELLKQSR